MAQLCLSLTENTLAENLKLLRKNRPYIDCCELRIDYLHEEEYPSLYTFPEQVDLPVVCTLRRYEEGGAFKGSARRYSEILLSALRGPFQFVDLDAKVSVPEIEAQCTGKNITIIRSRHFVLELPANGADVLEKLPRGAREIPKLACQLQGTEDLFRLARIGRNSRHTKQIIIGMGAFGVPTRLLPVWCNSMLSYATAGPVPAAPGHLDPRKMTETFRFKQITKNTDVFGIIGNPVLHSRSPYIHNPGFARQKLDAVYIPFPTDDPQFFLRYAGEFNVKGLSVTVPHKESAARIVELHDEAVRDIGSCNTLTWDDKEGEWKAYNTDYSGFMAPLKAFCREHGKRISKGTVIGAGGAARAVVYALVKAKVEVCIINRTSDKAQRLAEQYGIFWSGMNEEGLRLAQDHRDLIVQTTSAGMKGSDCDDPWPDYRFSGDELVYEIVYTPVYTPFLIRAQKAGCSVLTGDMMLQKQGEEQFFLFTGKQLNIEEEYSKEELL